MGRWNYTWRVEYYGGGGFLHREFIEAKNRELKFPSRNNKIIIDR